MVRIAGRILCEGCFSEQEEYSPICGVCGLDKSAVVENTGALPMGMTLMDKYIIGNVLGRGGFGITYLAYDKVNQQKVAIKEYFPDSLSYRTPGTVTITNYTGDREEHYKSGVNKFYNEARILSRFNGNDHIINVMEFFYANNTAYYVMEYVNGIDLKKYIAMRGGRLPYNEVLDIMVPVMYALIIVHSMDILHRDISPDNIYLTKDGDIKILDFGAARQVFQEQSSNLSVILKQGFTPIEQYRKRGNHGPWSDIYSLGATVYYALTGSVPEESVNRVERDDLRMPSALGIPVPADFEMILRKMLAVKAENRFQSMIELKEAMRNLGAASGTGGLFPRTATKVNKLSNQWIIGIAAGAVCLIIIVVLIMNMSGNKNVIDNTDTPVVQNTASQETSITVTPVERKTVTQVIDEPYTLVTTLFNMDCSYSGEWSDNAPNGQGVLTVLEEIPYYWLEGTKITGVFTNGLLQGEGKQENKDGSTYTGGFRNGLRSGQGTYTWPNGTKVTGESKNHFLNGKGTAEYYDGSKYEGDFTEGYMDGRGKMTYADGSVYEGDFVNDKLHGEGTYTFADGRYVGSFADDTYHGHGILYDAKGNITYDGEWVNGEMVESNYVKDMPYVYKTSMYAISCSYTGEWKNGMPNGEGMFIVTENGSLDILEWSVGDEYVGTFVNGLLEGYVTQKGVNGFVYAGNFEKGMANGEGLYTIGEGVSYVGNFVNDRPHGYGTQVVDGWMYIGEFSEGYFHGEGILYNPDGEVFYSGAWVHGDPAN